VVIGLIGGVITATKTGLYCKYRLFFSHVFDKGLTLTQLCVNASRVSSTLVIMSGGRSYLRGEA
jgi:hypothetical protein